MTLLPALSSLTAALARILSRSGSVSPAAPSVPAWRKLRRVTPSQSWEPLPKTLNIVFSLAHWREWEFLSTRSQVYQHREEAAIHGGDRSIRSDRTRLRTAAKAQRSRR